MWKWIQDWWSRLLPQKPGDWDTAGEPTQQRPLRIEDQVTAMSGAQRTGLLSVDDKWTLGWWQGARRTPAHPGRIGKPITPRGVVVHTTDTLGGFEAIIESWTKIPGRGNAAHFMVGRTIEEGVVQFAPVVYNANHAGGPTHGYWSPRQGVLIHPNTVAVGIELVAGGKLERRNGEIVHADSHRTVPISEVFWDSWSRPWHAVTSYQLNTLRLLLHDLLDVLKPMPQEWTVRPSGDYTKNGVAYYAPTHYVPPWLVGHTTLDPVSKTDPGPQVMQYLETWRSEWH